MHALVPGGGPTLDGTRWIKSRHPQQRRKRKPYLVDNELLSTRFRELFIAGVERLLKQGELQCDPAALRTQLSALRSSPWVVFIEAPPREDAAPEQVLKYLARYMTGGPISDRRLVSQVGDDITFLARSDDPPTDGSPPPQVPVTISGVEFVRRWSLHILPKGFTKVRRFGGYSNRHCQSYLERCRAGLGLRSPAPDVSSGPSELAEQVESEVSTVCCPHCRQPLVCLAQTHRPSWWLVMTSADRPFWYGAFRPRDG